MTIRTQLLIADLNFEGSMLWDLGMAGLTGMKNVLFEKLTIYCVQDDACANLVLSRAKKLETLLAPATFL